jgi:hypothetical protein
MFSDIHVTCSVNTLHLQLTSRTPGKLWKKSPEKICLEREISELQYHEFQAIVVRQSHVGYQTTPILAQNSYEDVKHVFNRH